MENEYNYALIFQLSILHFPFVRSAFNFFSQRLVNHALAMFVRIIPQTIITMTVVLLTRMIDNRLPCNSNAAICFIDKTVI